MSLPNLAFRMLIILTWPKSYTPRIFISYCALLGENSNNAGRKCEVWKGGRSGVSLQYAGRGTHILIVLEHGHHS